MLVLFSWVAPFTVCIVHLVGYALRRMSIPFIFIYYELICRISLARIFHPSCAILIQKPDPVHGHVDCPEILFDFSFQDIGA